MTSPRNLLFTVAAFAAISAQAATYDFTGGISSTNGWQAYTPLVPFGTVNTLSDGPGGYELYSGASVAPSLIGPARIGSLLPLSFSDFTITFDVLNYSPSLVEFFGAAARVQNVGLGTTAGYVMGYDNVAESLFISKVANESSQGPIGPTAFEPISLTPGNAYHFVFTGYGSSFNGEIFNLGSSTPLAMVSGTDSSYAQGQVGLLVASQTASGTADATFGMRPA